MVKKLKSKPPSLPPQKVTSPPCFTSSSSSPPWCPRATSLPSSSNSSSLSLSLSPLSLPKLMLHCWLLLSDWSLMTKCPHFIPNFDPSWTCRMSTEVDLYLWHVFRNLLFVFVFDHLCRIGKWYKVKGMKK